MYVLWDKCIKLNSLNPQPNFTNTFLKYCLFGDYSTRVYTLTVIVILVRQ